ncbi:hypothetical protein ACHAW6_002016, partial [Cyclotella cf. meneghiniana]
GYTFEAEVDGKTFTVTVPLGGVEEGEKFSVPCDSSSNAYQGDAVPCSSIPVGLWKASEHIYCAFCINIKNIHHSYGDVLIDTRMICVLAAGLAVFTLCCGMLGVVHLLIKPDNLAILCKVLLGQVMHRLKLTWLANEGGSEAQTASTFRILFCIGMMSWILWYSMPNVTPSFNGNGQPTDLYFTAHLIVNIVFRLFAVFRISLICKTRKLIRNKYQIPSQQCHGCEDECCALWCSCCTLAQMARHTGDYASYQGECCSQKGLPPHAPSIV